MCSSRREKGCLKIEKVIKIMKALKWISVGLVR